MISGNLQNYSLFLAFASTVAIFEMVGSSNSLKNVC